MNEHALVTTEGRMLAVKIDPDTIESIISISDDDVLWLKIAEGGFLDGDDFLTAELRGIVFDIKPYWIRWNIGEPPEKIPFRSMDDQPEGFELRTDLKIKLLDDELVGLSLAPSSSRNFSRYMRRLQGLRLPISEIVTSFSTRAVVNKQKQKFTILDFDFILPPKTGKFQPGPDRKAEEPNREAVVIDAAEDDVPF